MPRTRLVPTPSSSNAASPQSLDPESAWWLSPHSTAQNKIHFRFCGDACWPPGALWEPRGAGGPGTALSSRRRFPETTRCARGFPGLVPAGGQEVPLLV